MAYRYLTKSSAIDFFCLGFALFSCAYLYKDILHNIQTLSGRTTWSTDAIGLILAASLIYASTHILRAIRLWIIVGSDRLSFRAVFGCNIAVSIVTFSAPYKLGEILRAGELFRLLRNDPRGLFAVWLDRLFDVGVMLLLLSMLSLSRAADPFAISIFVSLSAFLLISTVMATLLPGALASFLRALLQSRSQRSLTVLRSVVKFKDLVSRIPLISKQTLALLVMLTIAVWGFELLTIFFLLIALPESGHSIADQAVDILNYTFFNRSANPAPCVALYRLLCVITLLVLVIKGVVAYVRTRMATLDKLLYHSNYRLSQLFTLPRLEPKGRLR